MLLLPIHKDDEESVIIQQLYGWIFESHLWKPDGEGSLFPATCLWCGLKSDIDISESIQQEVNVKMCRKNTYIIELIKTLREEVVEGVVKSAEKHINKEFSKSPEDKPEIH